MKHLLVGFILYVIVGIGLGEEAIDYEDQKARKVENFEYEEDNEDLIAHSPQPVTDVSSVQFQSEPLRNLSDYNEHELAFINSMYSLKIESRRRSFRSKFRPRCYFENWTAACCINFNVTALRKNPYECKTCIETGLKLDKMQAFAALYFNQHELYEKDFNVGKICWPLPAPLSKIHTCYWVYHMDINFKERRFESCALLEITPFFHVGFNCLLLEHGHFSIHDRIQPEHKGLFNVELVGGRLKFEVESPTGKRIKYWFMKIWSNFKKLFRNKSAKFIAWLRRRI